MLRNLKFTVAALAVSALLPAVATAQTVLTMSSWVPPSHSLTVTLAPWQVAFYGPDDASIPGYSFFR